MAVEEIPFGNQFENLVKDLTKTGAKRITADVGSKVFKMLSVATEPFFRREMGERHFSLVCFSNGCLLWFFTWIASGFTGTLISPILGAMGLDKLATLFHSPFLPAITALGVLIAFVYFSKENFKRLAEFRAEGKTYHSRSRGQPRWPNPSQQRTIRVGGCLLLLLFAPLVGVIFVLSMYVSANLAAQQQAALHDRYLDALDAQIEGEFLQDAILGKCPPEITFLYKPLPSTLKPQLREDIAAAAVGKPVKIVAQAPKPTPTTRTPEPVMQS